MTLPNRPNYGPVVVTCPDESFVAALSSEETADLQSVTQVDESSALLAALSSEELQDLHLISCMEESSAMLATLPREESPDVRAVSTKEVKDSRKRMHEGLVFQGHEDNRSLHDTEDRPPMVDREWVKRRMLQREEQEPKPSTEGEAVSRLHSLTWLLAQASPYAIELATRNDNPKKRARLPLLSKKLMNDWFEHHLHHPYPTDEEKKAMALEGGIAVDQVNNWFINTRGRKWKPMLKRLMAEKKTGNCSLYDKMVDKIREPYNTQ